ncbi:MAG: aminotransferase class V-fold PLP-dependent enzyme [Longimicrobiales bacterium]|nr:aminotransferase class V-fold PLP-dependent enzyme [Longimicrobiales bacterium]
MNLDRLRAETPATARVAHLNNAGASLQPAPVVERVIEHLRLEEALGGYEAADAAAEAIDAARGAVADLLETRPDQVALVEHATQGFVAALSSIPLRRGDLLLTTRHDYSSNQIQYLTLAERLGIEVVRAPDAPEGGADVEAMREIIHRRRPRVVAMTHIPTNSGLVQDVTAVGAACRERDTLFLVDACQSVGQMPVSPEAIGADFLSATGRKYLRGPRGTGLLWVSRRALDAGLTPLFPDLRGTDWIADDLTQPAPDATRFETWEFSWALVLGLGEAARYARAVGLEAIHERVVALAERLRDAAREIPGVRLLDRGARLCGIVTLAHETVSAERLRDGLRAEGVHTSWLTREGALLDFEEKGVETALRLSPHYYNTEEEVDRSMDLLAHLVSDA